MNTATATGDVCHAERLFEHAWQRAVVELCWREFPGRLDAAAGGAFGLSHTVVKAYQLFSPV